MTMLSDRRSDIVPDFLTDQLAIGDQEPVAEANAGKCCAIWPFTGERSKAGDGVAARGASLVEPLISLPHETVARLGPVDQFFKTMKSCAAGEGHGEILGEKFPGLFKLALLHRVEEAPHQLRSVDMQIGFDLVHYLAPSAATVESMARFHNPRSM